MKRNNYWYLLITFQPVLVTEHTWTRLNGVPQIVYQALQPPDITIESFAKVNTSFTCISYFWCYRNTCYFFESHFNSSVLLQKSPSYLQALFFPPAPAVEGINRQSCPCGYNISKALNVNSFWWCKSTRGTSKSPVHPLFHADIDERGICS